MQVKEFWLKSGLAGYAGDGTPFAFEGKAWGVQDLSQGQNDRDTESLYASWRSCDHS